MLWGPLILALSGIFAAGVSLYLHKKTYRLKFLGLFLASAVFIASEIAVLLGSILVGNTAVFITGQIIEWGHVYAIALILSSLLLFVRESKPEFSQFPLFYGALPLLIVFSYLLVYNTFLLKNWLINIYQGGAAVVTLLMYGIYTYRDSIYATVAAGASLFFITFLTFLFIPQHPLVWQLLLATSIVTLFSGHLIVEKHYEEQY